MKKLILAAALIAPLAGCETPTRTAAAGAVIGAAVDDENRVRGAAIGAAAGAAIELLRREDGDTCLYRNTRTGNTYRAACP